MAWTSPGTAVTGTAILASLWNASGRDNVLDLDRSRTVIQAIAAGADTTAGASYGNLATSSGPSLSVNKGAALRALVGIYAAVSNTGANINLMCFTYSLLPGPITFALDANAFSTLGPGQIRSGLVQVENLSGPGIVPIGTEYRTTGGTATFSDRQVVAAPLSA